MRVAASNQKEKWMPEKTITYEDYLKLTGLLTIAGEHARALAVIGRAAAQITGEANEEAGDYQYYGCTTDETNESSPSADRLLRKLGIAVEPQTPWTGG